jgi:hypothetical protein
VIRILLCGEGVTDVGQTQVWDDEKSDFADCDGWLQPVVRAIVDRRISFGSRRRRELILLPREQKKFQPLPPGHGAKALMAKFIATSEKFDAVIFMVDADGKNAKDWQRRRKEIIYGFELVQSEVRSIACVPKCTSESWLLSDSNAWRKVGLRDAACLPDRPEDSWGHRADSNGNHPHQSFARACANAGIDDSRDTRVALATATDLAILAQKCPISFSAFKSDLTRTPFQDQNCKCGNDCCS